ncbi:MAG TPA: Crp/Fnr family transcriptional regulator [Hyphomicrobium sp.]
MTNTDFDFSMLARRGIPTRRFDAGERIFLEQDTGTAMYVVRSGAVDVITFGKILERVGPGGIFGELALIDDAPRAAAALASVPTEVAVIDKPTFLTLITEEPEFALQIMRLMAERVRGKPAGLSKT